MLRLVRYVFLLALLFVAVPAQAQHKVKYSLACYLDDASTPAMLTTPLSQTPVGTNFYVALSCEDVRPAGTYEYRGVERDLIRGVFAAYLDVQFDKSLAKVLVQSSGAPSRAALEFRNAFTFSPPFTNGKQAFDSPDGLNRVGAFSSDWDGLDEGPHEVVRVKMQATKAGTVIFAASLRRLKYPMDDTLVMGNFAASPPEQSDVKPSEILLGRATLVIK